MKKLSLNRETLSTLTSRESGAVLGGVVPPPSIVNTNCPRCGGDKTMGKTDCNPGASQFQGNCTSQSIDVACTLGCND